MTLHYCLSLLKGSTYVLNANTIYQITQNDTLFSIEKNKKYIRYVETENFTFTIFYVNRNTRAVLSKSVSVLHYKCTSYRSSFSSWNNIRNIKSYKYNVFTDVQLYLCMDIIAKWSTVVGKFVWISLQVFIIHLMFTFPNEKKNEQRKSVRNFFIGRLCSEASNRWTKEIVKKLVWYNVDRGKAEFGVVMYRHCR